MAEKVVAIKVEVDTSQVDKNVKKTTKSVDNLGKQSKKTSGQMSAGFKGASDNASQLGDSMGGAAGQAVRFAKGIGSMTKAAIKFIATPLGAIIAAIVLVGASLNAFFTQSEKGQQKLRVVGAALSAVWDNMLDILADLGEAIIKVFSGDFKGAMETAKNSFNVLGDEMRRDVEAAIALERAMNNLKVSERELGVERAKVLKLVAEARLAAEDETKSAKERVDALKAAAKLEGDLTAKELANAKERFRIATEQAALNKSDEATLKIVADAEAAVSRVQLSSLNLNRRLKTEINSLEREIETERQQRSKAELDRLKAEADELQEIADLKFKLADEVAKHEVEIFEAQQDVMIELMEEGEAKEIEFARLATERRLNEIFGASEIERELRDQIEAVGLMELQAIRDKFANEELKKKKEADKKLLDEEQRVINARISMAQSLGSVLGSIGSIISQQSQEGVVAAKILAVARIAIDTAVALSGAIAQAQSVPFPGNIAAIAIGVAAVISGIASAVTTLNSANVPGPSATSPTAPPTVSAPAIQGVTTNTTELGNTEQAELAPIQAFVVETQLTDSQNNIGQIESQALFG